MGIYENSIDNLAKDGFLRKVILDINESKLLEKINQNLEKGKILDCFIYKGENLLHKIKLQLCAFADNEIEYINEGGILNKVVKDLALVK